MGRACLKKGHNPPPLIPASPRRAIAFNTEGKPLALRGDGTVMGWGVKLLRPLGGIGIPTVLRVGVGPTRSAIPGVS